MSSKSYQQKVEKGEKIDIEMPPITETETNVQEPVEQTIQQVTTSEEPSTEILHQDTQVQTKHESETPQARNFRQLKERAEKLERERDEALLFIQSLQKPTQVQPQEELDLNIHPTDYVEGKHLSKIEKKYKKLEEQLKQYQQQTAETVIETKLKTQFPDFDKVVTKDNVDLLKDSYPELAQTLNSSSDLYNKAVTAYTMLKKLGIYKEDLYEADRNLAQKNASKPKPTATISPQLGDTPLSKANAFAMGLTDDLKAQLRKEMEDARRNL